MAESPAISIIIFISAVVRGETYVEEEGFVSRSLEG